jgi:hypothetical membrane protein
MSSGTSPMVPRFVRSGAGFLIFGAFQFIVGMIVVQLEYPHYSLSANYISDLGGAHSPWALVFDASVILLGVCTIFGVLLVWPAFERGRSRGTGLTLILIGGIGAIGAGVFPETTPVLGGFMHDIVSLIAFVGGSLGLTVASFAMTTGPHWGPASRGFTLLCGVVAIVATLLFTFSIYLGLGPGGMERLIVAPILLWAIAEGAHIAQLPRFAPRLAPHVTA